MKLLFVRRNWLGSYLVRWGLNSDCSHFAVCFDDKIKGSYGSGIVFESSAPGVGLEWLGLFARKYQIMHALELKEKQTLEQEEKTYIDLLSTYSGQKYDYKAIFYWSARVLMNKILGVPVPKKNRWQVSGYSLCTGLAAGIECVDDWADKENVDLEIIGPHDLYLGLKDSGLFIDCNEWLEDLKNHVQIA